VDAPHPTLPPEGGGLRTSAPSPHRGEGRGEGDAAEPPAGTNTVPPDEPGETGDTMPHRVPHPARQEIELEFKSGPEKAVEIIDLPGISADLSRRIRDAVREEVCGEIRRLKGSLEPYRKEKRQ